MLTKLPTHIKNPENNNYPQRYTVHAVFGPNLPCLPKFSE